MEARFDCPSVSLHLRRLLSRTRGALSAGLALALAVHVGLLLVRSAAAHQRPAKPLTTQFVKRQPRLTKPLEMKKHPRPKRRQMQRRMVAVKARVERQRVSSSTQATEVLQRVSRPEVQVARFTGLGSAEFEPQAVAQAIWDSKEAEQTADMSLELLDINALDTGKYQAMVVQDPGDKRNVQGFCHLAVLYIPRLHDWPMSHTAGRGTSWFSFYVTGCVIHLADAMTQYTQVRADANRRLTLDDAELSKTPWLFFYPAQRAYDLSDYEMTTFGRYMLAGGLLFADSHPYET